MPKASLWLSSKALWPIRNGSCVYESTRVLNGLWFTVYCPELLAVIFFPCGIRACVDTWVRRWHLQIFGRHQPSSAALGRLWGGELMASSEQWWTGRRESLGRPSCGWGDSETFRLNLPVIVFWQVADSWASSSLVYYLLIWPLLWLLLNPAAGVPRGTRLSWWKLCDQADGHCTHKKQWRASVCPFPPKRLRVAFQFPTGKKILLLRFLSISAVAADRSSLLKLCLLVGALGVHLGLELHGRGVVLWDEPALSWPFCNPSGGFWRTGWVTVCAGVLYHWVPAWVISSASHAPGLSASSRNICSLMNGIRVIVGRSNDVSELSCRWVTPQCLNLTTECSSRWISMQKRFFLPCAWGKDRCFRLLQTGATGDASGWACRSPSYTHLAYGTSWCCLKWPKRQNFNPSLQEGFLLQWVSL